MGRPVLVAERDAASPRLEGGGALALAGLAHAVADAQTGDDLRVAEVVAPISLLQVLGRVEEVAGATPSGDADARVGDKVRLASDGLRGLDVAPGVTLDVLVGPRGNVDGALGAKTGLVLAQAMATLGLAVPSAPGAVQDVPVPATGLVGATRPTAQARPVPLVVGQATEEVPTRPPTAVP